MKTTFPAQPSMPTALGLNFHPRPHPPMPPSSPFSCRYSVAGYTEHMDERGEVRDPPPFEKVAEDWRDIGEQGRVGVAGMAAVMWLGRELWVPRVPLLCRLDSKLHGWLVVLWHTELQLWLAGRQTAAA